MQVFHRVFTEEGNMNGKPEVFITRAIAASAIERLGGTANVDVWPEEDPPPYEVLLQKAAHLDGLITLLTDPVDASFIQNAGRLQVISQMAVGFDNIDISAATERGIAVGHTPGVLTETTADFAWALLMAAARRVPEAERQVRAGIWKPWGPDILTGPDIFGATIGIVGFGRIGQAVARRARGFDMRILYNDPKRHPELEQELGVQYAELDQLLEEADFVTLHTYLSPETKHLIDRAALEKMKSSAILINTARGAVVDPQALGEALSSGKIYAAALDVFDPEPIPTDSPLLEMDNVIITPHIASGSIQTRARMAEIAVDNLLAGLSGERLPYCANPQVYDR
jgi:glyoxylate reductase